MLTKRVAIDTAKQFLSELIALGYNPRKVYLFGSTVKGTTHEYSDIDLAIWDDKFRGSMTLDTKPFLKLLVKYALLEVHSFNSNDDENSNPFIGVILKEGELIA